VLGLVEAPPAIKGDTAQGGGKFVSGAGQHEKQRGIPAGQSDRRYQGDQE